MAKHLVSSLREKGFTVAELTTLTEAGLLRGDDRVLWTRKSPSSWPKAYRDLWTRHTSHGNTGPRVRLEHLPEGKCWCGEVHKSRLVRLFGGG